MPKAFTMELETKEFNAHVQQMIKKYPGSARVILKKFALDLLARIVKNTPVDTGRARAAWYPAMRKLGLTVPLESETTKAEQIAKGKREGDYKDMTRPGAGAGLMYIDIINGVKYIIYLEYGYSKQAPYGMVRLSMRQLRGGKLPKALGARMRKDWKRGVGYFPTLESGKF